jgi:hypothetical protein
LCGGVLSKPVPHDGGINTHRLCIHFHDDASTIDLQVNESDMEWLRWIVDALDGRTTSWLSRGRDKDDEPR